jgi:hypothetical protein
MLTHLISDICVKFNQAAISYSADQKKNQSLFIGTFGFKGPMKAETGAKSPMKAETGAKSLFIKDQ